MYLFLRVFYEKNILQQGHIAILDNFSEAVLSIDKGRLTYFNRQSKKILYQCVENSEETLANGILVEKMAKSIQ